MKVVLTSKHLSGWSTKYALTSGVQAVEIDLEYGALSEPSNIPGYEHVPKYVYTRDRQQFITGKTFFLTRVEAATETLRLIEAKKRSIQKALTKLEKLQAQEKLVG